MNYYKILGLQQTASQEEIKDAYRELAKKFHPDKNPNSIDRFKRINEAYKILSDPQKRKQYDESKNIKNIKNIRVSNINIVSHGSVNGNNFGLNGIPSINEEFDNAMIEINTMLKNMNSSKNTKVTTIIQTKKKSSK